jgi:adenylate cyclase
MHLEAYEKQWGKSPESAENFKALSLKSVLESAAKSNPEFASDSFENLFSRLRTAAKANSVHNIARWWINIPLLADPTRHTGYFNAFQDSDGAIRRSALFVRRGNAYMPSLAMKTFLLDNNYTARATVDTDGDSDRASQKTVRAYEVLDSEQKVVMKIPVDSRGQLMINYAGPRNMFPYISAADILSDSPTAEIEVRERNPATGTFVTRTKTVDKKDFLTNKLLIIGATATGVYDLRVTPFEENYPGVETHANVLSNLLVEHARITGQPVTADAPGFMRTSPAEERYMWIALVGVGLTLSGLLTYFGSVAGLAITMAAIGAVYIIDKFLIFGHGTVIIAFFPIFMISSVFVSLTFYKYFTEERKKRELKGTFEKYVSPAIVAEVLADPENIELGGKKMELTVMFSDVRGFTTISEKLDPRALSDLLNSYLTPMTNLVFAHKGTLDKYMGDAIMAFWGAPIHFPDHAKHACKCALTMLVKLKELQEEYRAKGLPEIDIGIGLNTGEMSVGNMGSDTVRSYTVMGDAVNLGSRLEGINKQYGTRIIISEFTMNAVKDDFVTREVDWVRVKGKAQPVRIFELVGENGQVDENRLQVIKHFGEGFHLYHAREFAKAIEEFKKALEINNHDACTQLYIERCQDYLEEPPAQDWDGVYTMKTK